MPLCGGYPLAGLISVNRSDFPSADGVPQERVAVLEERLVVARREGEAMTVIEDRASARSAERS